MIIPTCLPVMTNIAICVNLIQSGGLLSSPYASCLLNMVGVSPTIDHFANLDGLDSFVERFTYIHILTEWRFPFKLERQPEAWIQRLLICKDAVPAIVVELIDTMFGRNAICRDMSEIYDYPITVIGATETFMNGLIQKYPKRFEKVIPNIEDTLALLRNEQPKMRRPFINPLSAPPAFVSLGEMIDSIVKSMISALSANHPSKSFN